MIRVSTRGASPLFRDADTPRFPKTRTLLPSAVVVFFGLVLGGAATAGAHTFLDHARPKVGSTVEAPPAAITLVFTEAVEPALSRVDVLDAAEHAVAARPLEHPAADTLVLPLAPLAPGSYTVHWRVVSVDTHATEGRFDFAVKPKGEPRSRSPSGSTSPGR